MACRKIKKKLRKSAEKRYAKSGQEKFLEKYQQGAEQVRTAREREKGGGRE